MAEEKKGDKKSLDIEDLDARPRDVDDAAADQVTGGLYTKTGDKTTTTTDTTTTSPTTRTFSPTSRYPTPS